MIEAQEPFTVQAVSGTTDTFALGFTVLSTSGIRVWARMTDSYLSEMGLDEYGRIVEFAGKESGDRSDGAGWWEFTDSSKTAVRLGQYDGGFSATRFSVVCIERTDATRQTVQLLNGRPINATTLMNVLDRMVAMSQDIESLAGRAILQPPTDSERGLLLPSPDARKNSVIGFGDDGYQIEMTSMPDLDAYLVRAQQMVDLAVAKAQEAGDFASDSENAAIEAADSEANAKASEKAAKDSETNAKASEQASSKSETNAKASETSAAASAQKAQELRDSIALDEAALAQKVADASASAAAAKVSESNAKASKQAASESESNAKASASAAATSETNARASEVNARSSESNAKASEQKAAASEANAKTSETNAKTSETNAKSSATDAKTSETNAQAAYEKAYALTNARCEIDSDGHLVVTVPDGASFTFSIKDNENLEVSIA